MKIKDIEAWVLTWPPFETIFWTSINPIGSVSELLIKVTTDDGIVGIGEAHGGNLVAGVSPDFTKRVAGAAPVVTQAIRPMLLGENPLENDKLWDKMFSLTYQQGWGTHGWSRSDIMTAIAGVDIALWDIKGKAAGVSVNRLLGGFKQKVHCYVMGGYYQEGKEPYTEAHLARDAERWVKMGYNAIKIKIAHVSIEEDVKRIKALRDAIGYDIDLMLDANEGYSVQDAIRAIHAFEPFKIRWYEEPVHWYDNIEGLAKVAASTTVPLHAGEQQLHRFGCRDLIERGKVSFTSQDGRETGGVTGWVMVAAIANVNNALMAPHHDPQIHGQLVAAVPNGLTVETFPEAARDPIWSELFAVRPEIKNSYIEIPDRPGFGIEVDEKVVEKRGTKVP
ncbi:MAG: mandelate racemase/muconate lactonizing enzyme family protein [Chloroflexi bacterium]|nr:mandelate racemase/muconate lactonizing enzyme family protein [Chloroflexota bacterium]